MELTQLHKYVDLYFEGQATREQEAILMDYFSQPVVDVKLAQFKPYFEAIASERKQTYQGQLPVKPSSKTNWRRAVAIATVAVFGFFMTQLNNTEICFEGIVRGEIATALSGTGGFGYDPLFIPEGYSKTFGALPRAIKLKLSHRSRAITALFDYLKSLT